MIPAEGFYEWRLNDGRGIGGIAFHQDAIEALGFGNRCRSAGIFPGLR